MAEGLIIYDTDDYALVSYHNGLSYELRCKFGDPDENLFLQGEDAAQFREELEGMEAAAPKRSSNSILRELYETYSA